MSNNLRSLTQSSTVVTAVIIAVLSMFLFSLTHSSVRLLSDTMSAFEIVFWRMFISLGIITPWYAWKGLHYLKTKSLVMHSLRSIVNFGGMILWFDAIAVVPLGKAVAIHFVLPIFVLALAALILREKVGVRRISAAIIGFGGMLVVLRPGQIAISWPEVMILGSALCYAATVIFLKYMVKTETPLALTFYTNLFILVFTIPFTIYLWVPPTVEDIVPILIVGLTGTFAPFMYTSALRMADASIIAPTDFLRLPITAGLGFALFGEVPAIWVWIGGGIIFLSTWYITARENKLERERKSTQS